MQHCDRCDADIRPVSAISQSGAVRLVCPRCEADMGAPAEGGSGPRALRKTEPRRVEAHTTAENAPSLVEQIRSRLRVVDEEIARAAGLAAERKTLAAMLRAAEKGTR